MDRLKTALVAAHSFKPQEDTRPALTCPGGDRLPQPHPVLLTIKFNNRRYSAGHQDTVSPILANKWRTACEQVVSEQFLSRLAQQPISLAALQAKNQTIRSLIGEHAKMANKSASFIERVFSKKETAGQLEYLKKIYKFSFLEPYLRNRSLAQVQSVYFKYLKYLRNQYLKVRGQKEGEDRALDWSFDIYAVRKYVQTRVIRDDSSATGIKDRILRHLSVFKQSEPDNDCVIKNRVRRFQLTSIDLSAIERTGDQQDALSDIDCAQQLLADGVDITPVQQRHSGIVIRGSWTATSSKLGNRTTLLTSTLSRMSKLTPVPSLYENCGPLDLGTSDVHRHVNGQERVVSRIESINEDTRCTSRDTMGKFKLPRLPMQTGTRSKLARGKSTQTDSDTAIVKRPPSMPPISKQFLIVRSSKRKTGVLHRLEQCMAELGSDFFSRRDSSRRSSAFVEMSRNESMGEKMAKRAPSRLTTAAKFSRPRLLSEFARGMVSGKDV